MFRLETTWTTDKNNLYLVREQHARVYCVDIIGRRARAGSPVRQRKVVSKKVVSQNRKTLR